MVPEAFQGKPKQKVYQLAENLFVTVIVVNNSDRDINTTVADTFYGNRPALSKDGMLLPCTEEVINLLRSKDTRTSSVELSSDITIPAKSKSAVANLDLKKWYGNLAPGLYKLTNQHRFEIDGPWTSDSVELLFEIVR